MLPPTPIMRSLRRLTRRVPGIALMILALPAVCLAAKTDLVILRNGDKLTGEVKGLSRGKLDYSTDDAGRLAIEWLEVARVTSLHEFEVEVASGLKYLGHLSVADHDGGVAVGGERGDTLAIPDVVRMSALDAEFLQRVTAYLDVGLTLAAANNAKTFSLSGQTTYRGPKFGSTLTYDSYAQGQESVPTTTRNSAGLRVTRFLPKRWSAVALAMAEQNDELDLLYRYTVGGAAGHTLIQSNQTELIAGLGLVMTREQFSQSATAPVASGEAKQNLEAMVVGSWKAFRFDTPKLDFSSLLNLYPSLSTPGRVRGEFSTRLKYELFPDFNVGFNLTDTFDSQPLGANAAKNDYVMSFTIGWSYRR